MIRLASAFIPHVKSAAPSVLKILRGKGISNMAHRQIPSPEPNPEPNPEPDGMANTPHLRIAPEDWDELFHAVTVRLEACVDGPAFNKLVNQELDTAKSVQTTVLECVSALNQLHAALLREQ